MAETSPNPTTFSRILLQWNREKNSRQMPWKNEKDPYKIWLSEIILQQTRVEQGMSYYNNFIRTFPNIHQLAKAPAEKVFKLWEGLGYYSRCRNLIATAQYISKELNGKFPNSYDEIRSLKGIGPYTAAAISSFAFNLPYAVLDGNVFRVLARIFGIDIPTDSTIGKKRFAELSDQLLDKENPGIYNQAIMDFGAVICKPIPLCGQCMFKKYCFAFINNKTGVLPVKEKRIKVKTRWFYYLVVEHDNKTAIRKRTEKDIWQELYEFPMIEAGKAQNSKTILFEAENRELLKKNDYDVISISKVYKQQLTHQLIKGQFLTIRLKRKPVSKNDWLWLPKTALKKYAFSKLLKTYVLNKSVQNFQ